MTLNGPGLPIINTTSFITHFCNPLLVKSKKPMRFYPLYNKLTSFTLTNTCRASYICRHLFSTKPLFSLNSLNFTSNSNSIEFNYSSQQLSQVLGQREFKKQMEIEAKDNQLNPNQSSEKAVRLMEELLISPDPKTFTASMNIIEYIQKYGVLDNGDRLEDVQVSLAGRITSKRSSSNKLFFYDLDGDDAKVQIVADAQTSGMEQPEFSNLHSSVKLDDIVGVTGLPGKSKRGELSIFPKIFTVLPHPVDKTGTLDDDKVNSSVQENQGMPSLSTSFRLVVVGDIHEEWELQSDSKALEFLQPDLVFFTGDFGNESVDIVRSVSGINMPKAAILGNHDSWTTQKFSSKVKDGVQLQLEYLGEQHVGYSHLDFPAFKLSVVGGRPFSLGGDKLFRKKLITKSNTVYGPLYFLYSRYGVRTMEESAEKIYKAAIGTPKDHSIIFLAHNGPTGLGSNKDDICGRDWVPEGGDNGDPDLDQAISLTKKNFDYPIPLVVFGHMHHEMVNGETRKMMVTADNTMYVNAAIVPRVKPLGPGGSLRVFTVVEFSSGEITKVAETWVSVIDDKISLEEEKVLFSSHNERT